MADKQSEVPVQSQRGEKSATEYTRREALEALRKYSLGVSVTALTASAAVSQAAASTGEPEFDGDCEDWEQTPPEFRCEQVFVE
ncbi:MAG: hypothetical protein AAF674_21365 [Pseudomonadota bacterium]